MKQYLQEIFYKWVKEMPFYKRAKIRVLGEYKELYLKEAIEKAIENVPFYSDYSKYTCEVFSITNFPIIRKSDIVGKEESLVSKKYNKKFLYTAKTGGSTGVSLKLFYSLDVLQKKNIVSDYAFSLIGEDLNIAVLRGNKTDEGQLMKKVNNKKIILSSYHLTESNLDEYIEYLKQYRISCLHVYPSSISIFARLIKNKYGTLVLPDLKGIVASSEIFSREEKMLVQEVFPNVKIVDYYGHNELACCALAEGLGNYKFYNNFGYVEFVDTGETINGNRIAEIVATSILNTAMPLVRYATDDYVELDENNNVVSIIGRTSDFLVNKNKQLMPCIVILRKESKINMNNFQYYQCKEGELIFRIVVNDKFSEQEKIWMIEDLNKSFNGLINCSVEIVDEIERTSAGKQKRLIQMLDLNCYK